MALITDQFFYQALRTNADIIEMTDGRIFNPARPEEDDNEDRIPYIIISHNGGTNSQEDKDFGMESDTDTCNIAVLCVTSDRESLADLTQLVRDTLKKAIRDDQDEIEQGYEITDYTLSYDSVQMDITRPCVYQTLTYNCETTTNV